ncbi:unnamed protein product [Amoebophrya sp. A120]|nr:unnamed protein product [Amoebophrya sp. A120]|eukprot:GSA120T00018940001.1
MYDKQQIVEDFSSFLQHGHKNFTDWLVHKNEEFGSTSTESCAASSSKISSCTAGSELELSRPLKSLQNTAFVESLSSSSVSSSSPSSHLTRRTTRPTTFRAVGEIVETGLENAEQSAAVLQRQASDRIRRDTADIGAALGDAQGRIAHDIQDLRTQATGVLGSSTAAFGNAMGTGGSWLMHPRQTAASAAGEIGNAASRTGAAVAGAANSAGNTFDNATTAVGNTVSAGYGGALAGYKGALDLAAGGVGAGVHGVNQMADQFNQRLHGLDNHQQLEEQPAVPPQDQPPVAPPPVAAPPVAQTPEQAAASPSV